MKSKQILPECDRLNAEQVYQGSKLNNRMEPQNIAARYHLALEAAEKEIEKLRFLIKEEALKLLSEK